MTAKEVWDACIANDAEGLTKLLITSSNIDSLRNEEGYSLLQYACEHELVEAVRALLQCGANPDTKTDKWSWTPLHHACMHQNMDIAKLLLAHGANVNALTGAMCTTLDLAYFYDLKDVAEFLKLNGAIEPGYNAHNRKSDATQENQKKQNYVVHVIWQVKSANKIILHFCFEVLSLFVQQQRKCK